MLILRVNRRARRPGHFSKARNHPRADWAWLSVSNGAPVGFDHRNNFRRRAGEKTFVCGVDIVPRDVGLARLDTELGCNLKDNTSGNSTQRPAVIGGVKTWPRLITKTLSAVHSATLPASFNMSASSALARFASIRAITLFK